MYFFLAPLLALLSYVAADALSDFSSLESAIINASDGLIGSVHVSIPNNSTDGNATNPSYALALTDPFV